MDAATGTGGTLRVGYQTAARLGAWSLAISEDPSPEPRWTLRAALVGVDRYWSQAAGLRSVRLSLGRYTWAWDGLPEDACQFTDTELLISGTGRPVIT